jgi:hypothetical protein
MVSFIGNRIGPRCQGIHPSRNISPVPRWYESIIGNGAGLFSSIIAHFGSLEFTNASPRHIDYNPVEVDGLLEFAGGVPAIKLISGKDFIQIETAAENLTPYSEDMTNQWSGPNIHWGDQDYLGGVMTKLVENNDSGQEHNGNTGNVHSLTSGNTYVVSIYVHVAERTEIRIAWGSRFPAGTWCEFDVGNGVKGSKGAGVAADDYGIYHVKDGIYRCWFKATCNSTGTAGWGVTLLNEFGNRVYNGDGSSGLYIWGGQAEDGTPQNASSYIETTGSAVIRAKDQAYWASANVPDALRGDLEIDWIPYGDNAVSFNEYLLDFKASGSSKRYSVYYRNLTDTFIVLEDGATIIVESGAVTFEARQTITLRLYPSDGILEVEGCDTGDGSFVGTPWGTTEGDVRLGQSQSSTLQCNGLISEPHSPRYLRDPLVLANFDDANFTNASQRDLDYPLRGFPSVEHFASGVLAEATIGKNRFFQCEVASTNELTENRDFEAAAWSKDAVTISSNIIEAPDNNLTADKIVENTANAEHGISQNFTPDGVSKYVLSLYVRGCEREKITLELSSVGFTSGCWARFDVPNGGGSVEAQGAGIESAGIEYCGNGCGWYRIWIVGQSIAALSTAASYILYNGGGGAAYQGDGSSGLYVWNAQVELGTSPSSPIHTEASPITRAKDQLVWPSASVPALLRGRFKTKWIPYDDQDDGDDRVLIEFDESGASNNIQIYYRSSTDEIIVVDQTTSTTLVTSNALTFSRLQQLTISIDPDEGSVEVQGVSSGSGKVIGTSWTTTTGDVYYGQRENLIRQCKGLLSEPHL